MALADAVPKHRPVRLQDALHEATRILREEFGNVDQQAAVSLATYLYNSWERQEFLERREEPDALPYGGQ